MQGSDGGLKLYWGIAADGSVVISDDLDVVQEGCVKSFAPFPAGTNFFSYHSYAFILKTKSLQIGKITLPTCHVAGPSGKRLTI